MWSWYTVDITRFYELLRYVGNCGHFCGPLTSIQPTLTYLSLFLDVQMLGW